MSFTNNLSKDSANVFIYFTSTVLKVDLLVDMFFIFIMDIYIKDTEFFT